MSDSAESHTTAKVGQEHGDDGHGAGDDFHVRAHVSSVKFYVGILATLLNGSSRPVANASTRLGAVTSYVLAIQARDANRAWAVLAQSGTQPAAGD